jgi:hypothetical protein
MFIVYINCADKEDFFFHPAPANQLKYKALHIDFLTNPFYVQM